MSGDRLAQIEIRKAACTRCGQPCYVEPVACYIGRSLICVQCLAAFARLDSENTK